MRIRKIVFAIVLLLIVFALVYVFIARLDEDAWVCGDKGWQKHGFPTSEMPTTSCGNSSSTFTKKGFIINDDGKTWNFIYEEPGKPAFMQKLDLIDAKCNQTNDCSTIKPDDNVIIKGDTDGITIKVYTLDVVK